MTSKLTSNFSKLIGSGGYSSIYMARFSGSDKAALKVHVSSHHLYQVFRLELDILLRLKHPSIVKLLGYFDDLEENGVRFFSNIFHKGISKRSFIAITNKSCHGGTTQLLRFSLFKLLNIFIRNVALRLYMGISRQVRMVGSPGYTDPHYLKTGIASKKMDMYGFGVVVLELVSAKEVFSFERGEMLVHLAAPFIHEILDSSVDC